MKSKQTTTTSSISFNWHMNAHPLAIAVCLLAFAAASEAKVVYTPVNVVISQPYAVDLNHDGVTDLTIETYWQSSGRCQEFTYVNEVAASGNEVVWGFDGKSGVPAALTPGVRIGLGLLFSGGAGTMAQYSLDCPFQSWSGLWVNVVHHYLGVSFKIDGLIHFGWARLSVLVHCGRGGCTFVTTLTGYAYETIPGKSITAGQISAAAEGPKDKPEL